jgi:hypothetical protein
MEDERMSFSRRELLQGTGMAVAAAALAAGSSSPSVAASGSDFSIDKAFADFMQNIGASSTSTSAR